MASSVVRNQGFGAAEMGSGVEIVSLSPAVSQLGVLYEMWPVNVPLQFSENTLKICEDDVLTLVQYDKRLLLRLKELRDEKAGGLFEILQTTPGFFELFQLNPNTPNLDQLLIKFKRVHTHEAAEIRLILKGEGVFTIWNGEIAYPLTVKKGSFIFIPAGCAHTFEPTDSYSIVALCVFQDQEGWKPQYLDGKP